MSRTTELPFLPRCNAGHSSDGSSARCPRPRHNPPRADHLPRRLPRRRPAGPRVPADRSPRTAPPDPPAARRGSRRAWTRGGPRRNNPRGAPPPQAGATRARGDDATFWPAMPGHAQYKAFRLPRADAPRCGKLSCHQPLFHHAAGVGRSQLGPTSDLKIGSRCRLRQGARCRIDRPRAPRRSLHFLLEAAATPPRTVRDNRGRGTYLPWPRRRRRASP